MRRPARSGRRQRKTGLAISADAFRSVAMAWKETVEVEEPPPKRLFVPTDELSIHEWERYGKRRDPGRHEQGRRPRIPRPIRDRQMGRTVWLAGRRGLATEQ